MYEPDPTPPFDGTEACIGADPQVFFDHTRTDAAQAICAVCPQFAACYEWAIDHENYGYWAGTTRQDRMAIREFRTNGVRLIPLPRAEPEPDVTVRVDSAESIAA